MDPNSTDPNNNKGQPDLSSVIPPGNPLNPNPDPTPTWPNTTTPSIPQSPEPAPPSFTPITPNPEPFPIPTTNLDNPMNVPNQPPVIDGGLPSVTPTQPLDQLTPTLTESGPTPTFLPNTAQPTNPSNFSPTDSNYPPAQPQPTDTNIPWVPPQSTTPMPSVEPNPTLTPQDLYTPSQSTTPQPTIEIPPQTAEQAPTDLSHLIPDSENINSSPIYTPPISQPETLIAPADGNEVTPNIPTEDGKAKMPKWVIGVGIGLFLAVAAASAYFILGVGQNNETATPAVEVSQPAIVPTIPIPAQPVVPISTGSASFGALNGASPTPPATSAADLIRQRQQQQGR